MGWEGGNGAERGLADDGPESDGQDAGSSGRQARLQHLGCGRRQPVRRPRPDRVQGRRGDLVHVRSHQPVHAQ